MSEFLESGHRLFQKIQLGRITLEQDPFSPPGALPGTVATIPGRAVYIAPKSFPARCEFVLYAAESDGADEQGRPWPTVEVTNCHPRLRREIALLLLLQPEIVEAIPHLLATAKAGLPKPGDPGSPGSGAPDW